MKVIPWLLQEDTPGVAYQARRILIDEDIDSRKMKSLRKRCNEYPPTARIIGQIDKALTVGDYKKYTGAYWTLIILADLYADGREKNIQKLAEHVLTTQLKNGGFSAAAIPSAEFVCLTANILRALVHFGYEKDQRILLGYNRLMERILPNGGVPCSILNQVLQTTCKMTLPQTLRCLAVSPDGVHQADLKKIRDLLIKQLLAVRVYQYVRPDAKAFQLAVSKRPEGVKAREIRDQWLAKHKVKNSELVPKLAWLQFGYPRSYNPDLLEAMLALTELGVKDSRTLNDPLDQIVTKRTKEGYWMLDYSLNGKMLADIELKGQPSKWITLRAMQVLKHFGRIDI